MQNEKKYIYLVVSQTGTFLSRILKLITKAEYNHISLGFEKDLKTMYSFGRKYPYNPITGGFVIESPHFGTFKRFYNTRVAVLQLAVDDETYEGMRQTVETIKENQKKYHYNYFGLILAGIKIHFKPENCYYCSEFVKYVLQKYKIEGSEKLAPIIQPVHFLQIPHTNLIYKGRLQDYNEDRLSDLVIV